MACRRHLIAVALGLGLAAPLAAQTNCLPRDVIVANLDKRYDEKPTGRGLVNETRLFEVFVSTDGSTWTLLQSFANGTSCIMAAGTHWLNDETTGLDGVEG